MRCQLYVQTTSPPSEEVCLCVLLDTQKLGKKVPLADRRGLPERRFQFFVSFASSCPMGGSRHPSLDFMNFLGDFTPLNIFQ